MSHLLCGNLSDDEVDPHSCVCDKLNTCNMTPYNIHSMTLNYCSETGKPTKQQNINCFPYFYNASNAFDIRFVMFDFDVRNGNCCSNNIERLRGKITQST